MIRQDDDFERRLTSWLRADAPEKEPAGLLEAAVTQTAATRRRPGWAIAARWMPAVALPIPSVRFTPRTVWLLTVMAVLAVVVAGVVAVGSLPRLPMPVGPARAGLIAFDSGGDILVTRLDGSELRNLTSTSTQETSPVFSPDGTQIAFWATAAAGMPASLWVMDADGSRGHSATGSPDFAGSENLQAAWSPDSQQMAFSVSDYYSSAQLFVVRADGTGLRKVGRDTLARSDAAWSPDGRLIAFRGHTSGVLPDAYPADPAIGVYVIAPDGTGERRISRSAGAGGRPNFEFFGGPNVGTAPSWSPDGGSVLFATGPAGNHALAIAAVDGSTERIIDLPPGDHFLPAFSPDGSRIAFEELSAASDEATVFVVDADGTDLQPLGGGALVAPNPLFWSPDGRFVVAYSVDLLEIRVFSTGTAAAGSSPMEPPISIALGAWSVTGFPERASWQRLAP